MKRIRKIQAITPTSSQVMNIQNDSILNTYSCDYINNIANGIVVESGSNANGTYIKYANGIMVCTKTASLNGNACNTALGSMYSSADISLGNWAQEFTDKPIYTVSQNAGSSGGMIYYLTNASKTSAGSIRIVRPTSNSSLTHTVGVIAIGNWE